MRIMIAFFCLFLGGFMPGAFAQNKEYQLVGKVVDNQHLPLENMTVSLLGPKDSTIIKSTLTDKEGNFQLFIPAPGKYRVLISAVDFKNYQSGIVLISNEQPKMDIRSVTLNRKTAELKEVAVVGRKSFIEQKADRMVLNVDASPSNAGSTVMDVLEKSPGVSVDKDGNISLKGKQGVMVMIDNKPTYLNATQLANYLKSLPSSAIDQIEIMTNPSAKYDAAGNSGIINIKTKKNKTKGFNGSVTLTHTQGVYPKPGASVNLNYRTGKANFFMNAGYTHWEGFQDLNLTRRYLDSTLTNTTSIFAQNTQMKFINPEFNLKLGMDYYLSRKTTLGFVLSGFQNRENNTTSGNIFLKDANNVLDSIVYAPSHTNSVWQNGSVNLNFRHQFDSSGKELTADIDYIRYQSGSDQYFDNITYYPDMTKKSEYIITGNLPGSINIYSFKSDYTQTLKSSIKLEAGIKSSYVYTDNTADYYNLVGEVKQVDTTKTNRFKYKENINAAYVNLSKQFKKWSVQAGLRLENTNYAGHQLGNPYTVNNNDSTFSRSYLNLFPTLYLSYQANAKNQFSINYGRRIDRPAYDNLNPFLFFLDQYTYQAGNPYLQPQFTHNVELAHTYNSFLTTTLNYSITQQFFTETFQQLGHATILRTGNIGNKQNAGISVSAQIKATKWWTAILYTNLSYNKYSGMLYGQNMDVAATTFMANLNNQFKFNHGWGAEVSGFYQTKAVEGQVLVNPLGQVSAAFTKQLLKDKANLKLGIRDIFYTQQPSGNINFQQTEAVFHNSRDSRQVSLSFTYRFGKPINGGASSRHAGGANDESNRVKSGGNN